MLQAAEECISSNREDWWMQRNPFKEPWGLQADGDLWEVVWHAILERGVHTQAVSKVRGHATKEQVEAGTVRACDKCGNDWADTFADKGALQDRDVMLGSVFYGSKGHVAAWFVKRQKAYVTFLSKVQTVIVAVLKVEKEERQRRKAVKTLLQGYGDDILAMVTCTLPVDPIDAAQYVHVHVNPPMTGVHRQGGRRQGMYGAVHNFIKLRKWSKCHAQGDVRRNHMA